MIPLAKLLKPIEGGRWFSSTRSLQKKLFFVSSKYLIYWANSLQYDRRLLNKWIFWVVSGSRHRPIHLLLQHLKWNQENRTNRTMTIIINMTLRADHQMKGSDLGQSRHPCITLIGNALHRAVMDDNVQAMPDFCLMSWSSATCFGGPKGPRLHPPALEEKKLKIWRKVFIGVEIFLFSDSSAAIVTWIGTSPYVNQLFSRPLDREKRVNGSVPWSDWFMATFMLKN